MTSGTTLRRTLLLLVIASRPATAADPELGALLTRLAQPAPATTSFVEVRFSNLLATPLVVSGGLEHRADGTLVRRVDSPYQETTELHGNDVRIERAGARPRQFSLDRAPELRGLLASFGALLAGNRGLLEQSFAVTVTGADDRWSLRLVPRDAKLQRRLAAITVDGRDAATRCFTLAEPDDDASVLAIGISAASELPQPIERGSLARWCAGTGDR